MQTQDKLPPVWLSLIPLTILIALLGCVIASFGSDALSGASQIALLLSASIAVCIGIIFGYTTWDEFEKAVVQKISDVTQAILILLLIGAISGAWMVSGIVPALIYYGMQILTPEAFLPCACIICAIVSLMTGSSWTTVATIGIALLGIGRALGFSDCWIAGAIISGAYFGDKLSPLSDTTVLASSTIGTPLFTHIKYMLITTIPTMLITLAIYAIYGMTCDTATAQDVDLFSKGLKTTFDISPYLMIIPIATAIMIAKKMPPLMVLFLSTFGASIFAVIFQPELLDKIAGESNCAFMSRFKGAMILVYGSTSIETGVEALNKLVSTKGMAGMMSTIWLIICAMIFGASMDATKMIKSITNIFLRLARSTVSTVASTVCVGSFLNTVCGDQYLTIILTGNIFKNVYQKQGFESRLLSRTVEDSATVTSVLVPWNTCAMAQSSVLGVATIAYIPYCFFNLISPLMSIFIASIGFKIYRTIKK